MGSIGNEENIYMEREEQVNAGNIFWIQKRPGRKFNNNLYPRNYIKTSKAFSILNNWSRLGRVWCILNLPLTAKEQINSLTYILIITRIIGLDKCSMEL